MNIDGEHVTDYWNYVSLDFRSDKGNVGVSPTHSQAKELEDLRDDILAQLDEHETAEDPIEDDEFFEPEDLEGLPDERIVARDYTHNLLALFALSCGIMEKQLEILLSLNFVPGILDDVEYKPFNPIEPDDLIDSYFHKRGLKDNLELANTTEIIGPGLYSEGDDVRETRNRLVHDPIFRLSIESYDAHRHRIKKAVKAPDKLDDLIKKEIS